ncbi:MAG: hypothetical protein ABI620_09365 [Chloroflexota bacterium]
MATESATTRESVSSHKANGGTSTDRDAVQTAVHEVRGALEGVGRSVPGAARASRAAVDDLFRTIESGSDERVSTGVTLSLGLAIGMLVGGAPRLLVALALVPLAAMGLVMADRRTRTGGRGSSSSS